jgi:hypothetical protein
MRAATIAAGVLALLGVPSLAARADAPAPAAGHVGDLVAGTARYVDGVYVWTDYAYDDRGPDTNTRAGGDASYPPDVSPNNVADLVQLQFRADGDRLAATAVLETLTDASRSPVIGIAVDSDADPATGLDALPGWQPTGYLGVDRLFVLRPGGGVAFEQAGDGWGEGVAFGDVATDTDANTISATLPHELVDAGTLRALAVVGYEDAGGSSWPEGATPIHDLAFVRGEDPVTPYLQGVSDAVVNFVAGGDPVWQDYRQSAIIAGNADVGDAVATIDVTKLRAGYDDPPPTLAKGFHTLLYRSALDLGEGVVGSGNAALFAGPYQPYLVWAPGGPTTGLPLVLYLHGSSQTHLSSVNTAPYSPDSQDPVLGLPDAFFDHFEAVVAWPLGRGPQQWYEGASEQDVLDVHDDVVTRLGLNRERTMLAGLSMGGIGTFRLAELYPDRWSTAWSDVGYDQTRLPENLTALPIRFQNGAADYLVHVNNALATRDLLDAAGTVDYRSFIRHQRHHQPAVALAECVYQHSFDLDRVLNPARVRYTVDPELFQVDEATGLHLAYDGAYWVDGMRTTGGRASVDLTSRAFGHLPAPQPTTRAVEGNLTAGADFCGPNPDVQTQDTWDTQARAVERVPIPPEARVEGTLANLEAVTIAADRAGVTNGALLLTATNPTDLTLTGLAHGTRVTAGGQRVIADASGVATIPLAGGVNLVSVRPRGR